MAASDAQWYRLEGDLLQRLKGRYEAALEVPQRREASECCCCHRTRDFWYSKPGETEFQMSQVCEYCFDVLTQEVPTAQRQRQHALDARGPRGCSPVAYVAEVQAQRRFVGGGHAALGVLGRGQNCFAQSAHLKPRANNAPFLAVLRAGREAARRVSFLTA